MSLHAIYVYTDDRGRPILRKCRETRNGEKRFSVQAAKVANDRVYWKAGRGVLEKLQPEWGKRVIYNLPVVLDALRRGEPVWLCEGERDADTLAAVARVATTTNHQGVRLMTPEQAAWFLTGNGESVINILADNDDAGAYGAWLRHEALLAVGVGRDRLRLWQPVEGHKDVTDAVAAVGIRGNAVRRVTRRAIREQSERYSAAQAAAYSKEASA